ncbi:hydroxymethylglutaryl-CoA reductase, degradative [Burkholderia sp. Ac-20379]|uniref:hydroxymethylglutaryl-CoA reductase, degradative n=1 Tax=Burkholderia sp. Ac-20379 TaxID=2703900 RepID=UPI0019824DE7|nr:hydroxymethylglutaryl-CoA reductase, degradative [Burkholderia sp. Ac-20379]MBN3728534.1 hydroxymethylglutaryl-CoA reductase, degradative [Burkholderia sp. Ac-20379]
MSTSLRPPARLAPDFSELGVDARLAQVAAFAGLSEQDARQLAAPSNLDRDTANHMIENMIATIAIPVGVATGLLIDGEERVVPMATEESWIVSAVGASGEACRATGGFTTSMSGDCMIAQVQLLGIADPHAARVAILERRAQVAAACDACDPTLVRFGGGFRDLEVRLLGERDAAMLVVHLIVDCRDAMGANTVNTIAERLAPLLAEWTGGRPGLRILSNLADRRLARARATWPVEALGGEAVRDAMIAAARFADTDPYRAVTHNKGIMNCISAVVLATGNDTRAVEAAAHGYAALGGRIRALTRWECAADGALSGSIELPMPVGIVGGATKVHPTARALLAILGVQHASELARIIAAIGLAANFAALKALSTHGIQKDFMARHAHNFAIGAGATGDEVEQVAHALIASQTIGSAEAERVLAALRQAR